MATEVSIPQVHQGKVCVINNPNLPQFRFEYHPETKKVYWMPSPTGVANERIEAFVLAEHCGDQGTAFGFVQTFCRGYKVGRKDAELLQTQTIVTG